MFFNFGNASKSRECKTNFTTASFLIITDASVPDAELQQPARGPQTLTVGPPNTDTPYVVDDTVARDTGEMSSTASGHTEPLRR